MKSFNLMHGQWTLTLFRIPVYNYRYLARFPKQIDKSNLLPVPDSPTMHVDLVGVDALEKDVGQDHHAEGLINLPQVNI
jgi:hypothetical protein